MEVMKEPETWLQIPCKLYGRVYHSRLRGVVRHCKSGGELVLDFTVTVQRIGVSICTIYRKVMVQVYVGLHREPAEQLTYIVDFQLGVAGLYSVGFTVNCTVVTTVYYNNNNEV